MPGPLAALALPLPGAPRPGVAFPALPGRPGARSHCPGPASGPMPPAL